MYMLCAD